MVFASLFRRLTRGPERDQQGRLRLTPRGRRAAQPRRFVPEFTVLEDRSLPSVAHAPLADIVPPGTQAIVAAQQQVPFKESLFEGATGTSAYVISTDPNTGVTSVEITGTISNGRGGRSDSPAHARSAEKADSHSIPFKVTGGGEAPEGLPVFPGGTAGHNATGTATHLGRYSGEEGLFTLLGYTSATTGTFQGSFVFVAANGDRLAFNYGANTPGEFTLIPTDDGKFIVQFDAEFTPVPEESTGRFAKVTGGSFRMIAYSDPLDLSPDAITEDGYTAPFNYTWSGEGSIEFSKGKQ
jgi:hypothetical protein